MKRILLVAAFLVGKPGRLCAGLLGTPISRSVLNTYNQDLAECQAYADQVSPVQDAAVGAIGGAARVRPSVPSPAPCSRVSRVGEGRCGGAAAGGVLGLEWRRLYRAPRTRSKCSTTACAAAVTAPTTVTETSTIRG